MTRLKRLPWPKLSDDAAHPKTPEACQCCGQAWDVEVYVECDEADRETTVAVTVCEDCARLHIEPHARLYRRLERGEPFPGAMSICVECPHRDGMRCAHHLLKANGGSGLAIRAVTPTPLFICGDKSVSGVVMDYGLTRPQCTGRPIIRGEIRAPKLTLLESPPARPEEPKND